MENWIEQHGDAALKRALNEGYDVRKGIGDLLVEQLEDSLDLEMLKTWEEFEARTSPRAESFASRDLVQACVKTLELPVDWVAEISQISRITKKDGTKCTGAMVSIRDETRDVVRRIGVNFES